jgi:iron complex transport system permease protein
LKRALLIGVSVLVPLLAITMLMAVLMGATPVAIGEAIAHDGPARLILLQVRLPRVVVAALAGAILAVCGATFQTILRNPLADPFVLGVSGGAACAAALATAVGIAAIPGAIPVVAFAGACFAVLLVLTLARRGPSLDPLRLLLAGMVLNALFSALILLSLSVIRGSDLTAALRWMMGSFSNARWSEGALLGFAFFAAAAILFYYASDLRMLAFGEEDARSRGVDTRRVILTSLIVASLATGAAVAASGIIGFVGLLVPHSIRLIWGEDFRLQLPLSALGGAALVVAADAVARTAMAPAELPIGALTALLGVPFFLLLLRRAR